ncbi:hypothetical protein [Lentzea nigeriaca]|uniref:hypothetical protein n=1 Tax=Lentzea nigeriaca TaxID=1128665 RepID=UPI00195F18C9|nr:hypothetical protein [Lentzea nigeriaca]MBM7858911.1 hypothetical protein [Lentzea nigeriaca]
MKTLVVLAVLAVIGTGTVVLVNHFGGWNTLIGKAWAITYEVRTEPAVNGLVQVQYLENPDRYKKQTPQSVTKNAPVPFTHEVVINYGEKAQVAATPNGDEVLSCRILLDGVKELASATAPRGQKVTCEATTAS